MFNTDLFLSVNGVHALTHALLDYSYPRLTEAMIGVLLRLITRPETR